MELFITGMVAIAVVLASSKTIAIGHCLTDRGGMTGMMKAGAQSDRSFRGKRRIGRK